MKYIKFSSGTNKTRSVLSLKVLCSIVQKLDVLSHPVVVPTESQYRNPRRPTRIMQL